MTLIDIIRSRKIAIKEALNNSSIFSESSLWIIEIQERFSLLEDLEASLAKEFQKDGSDSENLALDSSLCTWIQFHLDRCEALLESHAQYSSDKLLKDHTNDLLYARLPEILLSKVFAFLLRIRGRILSYETNFECLKLREYIYLKSPFWLEPLLRWMLPEDKI